MLTKTTIAAGLAAILIAGSTSGAFAYRAWVADDTYVYEDSDSDSDVMGRLEEGTRVDVRDRDGRWCQIRLNGPDGWVRCNRLTDRQLLGPVGRDDNPSVTFGFGINSSGEFGLGFGIGN